MACPACYTHPGRLRDGTYRPSALDSCSGCPAGERLLAPTIPRADLRVCHAACRPPTPLLLSCPPAVCYQNLTISLADTCVMTITPGHDLEMRSECSCRWASMWLVALGPYRLLDSPRAAPVLSVPTACCALGCPAPGQQCLLPRGVDLCAAPAACLPTCLQRAMRTSPSSGLRVTQCRTPRREHLLPAALLQPASASGMPTRCPYVPAAATPGTVQRAIPSC